MDKLAYAKRQLARIPVMYVQLMRMHPDGMPSLGMVARFDRVGGGSGRGGSIVETVAMKNLTLTEAQQDMLKWVDTAQAVYCKLLDESGKTGPKRTHDKQLAAILNDRVFNGLNFSQIRDYHFRPQISVQYVQKLYEECVKLVAQEAERRGLYKGCEGVNTSA